MAMADAVVDTVSELIGAFFSKVMPLRMNPAATSEVRLGANGPIF